MYISKAIKPTIIAINIKIGEVPSCMESIASGDISIFRTIAFIWNLYNLKIKKSTIKAIFVRIKIVAERYRTNRLVKVKTKSKI